MPIIKVNNFDNIGVSLDTESKVILDKNKTEVKFPGTFSLDALSNASYTIQTQKLNLVPSSSKWSLFLKSISLKEGFEGLFGGDNEIFFTSLVWDYSGKKPFVYPPAGSKSSDFIIPMQPDGTKRTFVGDGVNLFPAQQVVGTLNLILLVYESDEDINIVGDKLVKIHDQVSNSKLSTLVKTISASPSLAMGVIIGQAVNELLGVVGNIMKMNDNDYVDLFQGSYGTDIDQKNKVESYNHPICDIELEFRTSPL